MAFDLRTHIRDKATGKVVETQPYRLHIKNGEQWYERNGVEYSARGLSREEERLEREKIRLAEKIANGEIKVKAEEKPIAQSEKDLKVESEKKRSEQKETSFLKSKSSKHD